MAKRVFFSFHYQNVIDFRANVVRNHWVTKPDRVVCGFFDHSIWEETKKKGSYALKRMINDGLEGSTVSCVLIGSETYARPWVRYELLKSFQRGSHLLGVHINSIPDKNKNTNFAGPNPFDFLGVVFSQDGQTGTFREWNGSDWVDYTEIDGSATFSTNVVQQWRGGGWRLSHWFKTYDWVAEDGYNNFATWVA
jgi:hypothetical protein